MGYMARPFIRDVFPGYDIYVWLDADTWLQDRIAFNHLVDQASARQAAVVRQNERAYRFWLWQMAWINKHYIKGYNLWPGLYLAMRPMINNGVFAIHADAPHWERWRHYYQYALDRTKTPAPHDQFSLNAAVYLDHLSTSFLPATANWICDLATPMWNDEHRKLCVPYPPYEPISIVHLAGPAKTRLFQIKRVNGGTIERRLRSA
jgi:hypothetical protein